MATFSERLSFLIEANHLTQAEFARAFGISPQAVSSYIKGREPSAKTLIKISDFFHVSTDYLLGLSDSTNVSFSNYGDVAKIMLQLMSSGVINLNTREVMGDVSMAEFTISDYDCTSFFLEYQKMLPLYISEIITPNIFSSWLGSELRKLTKNELPTQLIWVNGDWKAPEKDNSDVQEGVSSGIDTQEND